MAQNKLKIVFVLSSTNLGGSETQAIILANEFAKRQLYQVTFVLFGPGAGNSAIKLHEAKIEYYIIKGPFSRFYILRLLRLIKYAIFLRKLKPDILMPYTTFPNIFTSLIWKYTGASLCIWNQRDEGIELPWKWINYKAINNAHHYIANSFGASNHLIETLKIQRSKVNVIHNGVEHKVFVNKNDWRKIHLFDQNDILIGMVANLSIYKDHETLLRSFSKILGMKKGVSIKLLLAGRFDQNYPSLTRLAKELNIEDIVFFMGSIDDVGSLLNAIDISVLSSRSEGFPNVVIESMLAGVPITGSRINGLLEVLGEDYSDYLADPGDPIQLAERTVFLLNHKEITESLVIKNRQRAKSLYSLDNLVQQTHGFIESSLQHGQKVNGTR